MILKSVVIGAVPMLLATSAGAQSLAEDSPAATTATSQAGTQMATPPSTAPATHPTPTQPPMGRTIAGERG
jgi:hypothetical protein